MHHTEHLSFDQTMAKTSDVSLDVSCSLGTVLFDCAKGPLRSRQKNNTTQDRKMNKTVIINDTAFKLAQSNGLIYYTTASTSETFAPIFMREERIHFYECLLLHIYTPNSYIQFILPVSF